MCSRWIPRHGRPESEETDVSVSVFVTRDLRTTCLLNQQINNIEKDSLQPPSDICIIFEPDLVPMRSGLFVAECDGFRSGFQVMVDLHVRGWHTPGHAPGEAELSVDGELQFAQREPDGPDYDYECTGFTVERTQELLLMYLEHYMPTVRETLAPAE